MFLSCFYEFDDSRSFTNLIDSLCILTFSFFFTVKKIKIEEDMATDGPSWADQWGAGGAMVDDDEKTKDNNSSKKKKDAKATAAAGLGKAKAAAMVGAEKIKIGTSVGFKWVKNQCQKKGSSK